VLKLWFSKSIFMRRTLRRWSPDGEAPPRMPNSYVG